MVSVDGVTYRIERLETNTYSIVRLNDDVHLGTFETGREIRVSPVGVDALLLEVIARDAVRSGKTSWVMHPRPSPPPVAEPPKTEAETVEAPVSTRRRFAPA
jgi:hypothetical protein